MSRRLTTCPDCGGHLTRVPEGRVEVPVVSIHPRRDEEPRIVLQPLVFDACDHCEFISH